jgi:ATP-binding cassette, subfamily C, bacterial CydC
LRRGTGADPLLRLVALARPRAGRFLLGVLAGATATGSAIALLALAGWLLATAATHPPVTALALAVVATRALGVTRGLARYAERVVTHDGALRTLAAVRGRVYARLAATEPVHRFRSADLVARLVGDTDATQDLLVRGLTPPLVALLAGGGAVALATALLVPGGLLLVTGLLLAGVAVPALAAAAGRGPGRERAAARAAVSVAVVDALHGAPDLVAHGALDRALGRLDVADAELDAAARRDALVQGLATGASTLVTGLTVWAVLAAGVAAVSRGALTTIPLAALVLTALAAFEAVAPLPAAAARLGSVRASAGRLFDVLDTPPAVRVGPAAPEGQESHPHARGGHEGGFPELRIRGLSVRYGPGEPWVLRDLDLDLPPGRRIAVVGPSGSGKSTLAAVLLRFRDPDAGLVTLGGTDVTTLTPDAVRTRISGMPADPHLFAGTVAANLRLASPAAKDADLRAVLERVRLGGLDLDDEIGTHGRRLSGGMGRRLALARALLTGADVLVLDEPTVGLDPATRDTVLDDVLAATRGRSLILITHDPARTDELDGILSLPAAAR